MLVLTRKAEEKIKIGDHIIVSVLSVDGGVVKLGIEAPKSVKILRMEMLEQVKKENIDAVVKDVDDVDEFADLFKQVKGNKG